MVKRVPTITQDELAAAIEEARKDLGDYSEIRPENAFSVQEYVARYGGSHTVIRDRLRSLVKRGLYEHAIIKGRDQLGRSYKLPVYRKIKQASSAKMDRI
jgi:hypothetical protein